MKIVALQAENIKKLVAVEIRPDGNIVEITGANGQGKTSILDSIWWALAGASTIQGVPIRKGQTSGRVRLDLGEIIVTRTFKAGKDGETTSSIAVENAAGARFPSPQSMLDNLLGQLTFDPLAFSRMAPREQFNTLRRFVPGVDFEAIENHNQADYVRRTEVNRQAKAARAAADHIVVQPGTPDEPIDKTALLREFEEGARLNSDTEIRQNNRTEARRKVMALRDQASKLMVEANDLQAKLDAALALPEPRDLTKISEQLREAEAVNQSVDQKIQKRRMEQQAEELEKMSSDLTDTMDQRDSEKQEAIAAAKLPVEGIGFGEGIITLNGVPFDQASDAEQLRASIAIAMALNPKLRVIRVRDGSLLDSKSMKLLSDMADAQDYQIWLERVDGSGKVGFVIEDGKVKATPSAKAAA